MGDSNKQKRHGKNYYSSNNQQNKRSKGTLLNPGCKGFIVTCNFQEQRAVTEAFHILNDACDKLYPQNVQESPSGGQASVEEDNLEAELQSLRNPAKKKRFNQCYTGVKNVLFIQNEVGDPCKIALSLLRDIKETKNLSSRFLLRLVPVLATCRPFLDNLKKVAAEVLDEFLVVHDQYGNGRPVTYAVQFTARHNTKSMKKEEVFGLLNDIVQDKGFPWKVNLSDPDLTLNVDVLGPACCFGILPDYNSLKRYNVVELAKTEEAKKDSVNSEGDKADDNVTKPEDSDNTLTKDEETTKEGNEDIKQAKDGTEDVTQAKDGTKDKEVDDQVTVIKEG